MNGHPDRLRGQQERERELQKGAGEAWSLVTLGVRSVRVPRLAKIPSRIGNGWGTLALDDTTTTISDRKPLTSRAEGVGFEPTRACALPVFKCGDCHTELSLQVPLRVLLRAVTVSEVSSRPSSFLPSRRVDGGKWMGKCPCLGGSAALKVKTASSKNARLDPRAAATNNHRRGATRSPGFRSRRV